MGAHPRSRGENRLTPPTLRSSCGSSPLTRGKPGNQSPIPFDTRLIPAHAGKTMICFSGFTRTRAHPRSRGENGVDVQVTACRPGSSPLTRGKREIGKGAPRDPGLIPAHAGKTSSASAVSSGAGAHPRSRGENSDPAYGRALSMGSSPLTRGKREIGKGAPRDPGLIPAHAGKTSSASAVSSGAGAHPRSRGENSDPAYGRALSMGSSPLTRGKPNSPASRARSLAAHPRSRGENLGGPHCPRRHRGSSPLTRGKLGRYRPRDRGSGLIPAHAGKTTTSRR